MDHTPNLQLDYLLPNQAQRYVTVNENTRRLDSLIQLAVLSASVGTQPTSPGEGDRYILPVGASGMSWDGFAAGSVVSFNDGVWIGHTPTPGWLAYVVDAEEIVVFEAGQWGPPRRMGINGAPDSSNRLTVHSDAVLFSYDSGTPEAGNVQLKLNKESVGQTASQLFQTGFSGRAELGLAGSDDFQIKVSSDGSDWASGMCVSSASGFVGVGITAPSVRLDVNGTIRSTSPAGQPHLTNADSDTILGPGESIDILDFSGLIFVVNMTTGGLAQYICGGGMTETVASVTSLPGTLSFASSPNRYVFTNTTDGTSAFRFLLLRARDAA